MKKRNLGEYKEAYDEEFEFYDENVVMLSWYSKRIIKTIQNNNCKSCLSLGIGHKIVSKTIIAELAPALDNYLIIEGSLEFIKELKNNVKFPSHVSIIHSLFEEFDTGEKFDVIEMGFVLEHVDDPFLILKRYATFLKQKGFIFIAVPNAKSFHRLIGYKAGMLDNLYRLSKYDLELGHKRYFDMESLVKLVKSSGLKIVNKEGIFFKPFSTSQLKSLDLSPEAINSLCSMGVEYPEISNAIYIEATP